MPTIREPRLHPVLIGDLRPTQITVGMREVEAKRLRWRKESGRKSGKKGADFLGEHMIPVVLGPKRQRYVIDHHHLARALHEEGVEKILVTVIADFSSLEKDAFWFVMDNRSLTHPYDENGKRCDFSDLPKSVVELVDDPFRSLAGALRRAGGFAKDTTPFSEFLWADFLRRRLDAAAVGKDFDAALAKAMKLARKSEAEYLPGWCGPSEG